MEDIKKLQEEFLLDMLTYYIADPVSRRNFNNTGCKYYPVSTKSEGCAVGRKIKDKQLCKMLDDFENPVVRDIFDDLPDDLKVYGQNFLTVIQDLHDSHTSWDITGLTSYGKSKVHGIVITFDLDIDLFKEFI